MVKLEGIEGVRAHAGQELGASEWMTVTQDAVDAFAQATGDHQWIHVEPERARETPFGGAIAHGWFTLSLAPRLSADIYEIVGVGVKLNYGANRVRFPASLPVGRRVRLRLAFGEVVDVPGGVQLTSVCTFEAEGVQKPVCVAETLTRIHPPAA